MEQAQTGKQVSVKYIGTLDDGSEFDRSPDDNPLQFVLGFGQVIPGFEQAIMGMNVGDTKKVHIPSADAYGERRDDMVFVVPKDKFPDNITPELGQRLDLAFANNQRAQVTVTKIEGDDITLDANHPMAGKDLNFELELLKVNDPPHDLGTCSTCGGCS